jgi:chlorobactene glucosyltransferase
MTEILAYTAFAFLGIRFMVVVSNTLYHYINKDRWHSSEALVSVLVPARNEESNIEELIDCLTRQEYRNIEIIICDDNSTDATSEILEKHSGKIHNLSWFSGKPLPGGWTGKNYACHQLSEKASGKYLLFLDADVKISGDIIASSVGYLEKRNLSLLSIFPRQQMLTTGERITVPLMNWILLSLLPLPLITYCRWPVFSAANGQFMLFRADHYHIHKPHKRVKSSPVEDIQIARLLKRNRYRVSTILGDFRMTCRMYRSYREAVAGFSKNVFHFFQKNLLWILFFVCFTTLGPGMLALWSKVFLLLYLILAILKRILISVISSQAVLPNLLWIPVQQIAFLHIVMRAFVNMRKGKIEWKARKIPV